jgi:hypothetical protein
MEQHSYYALACLGMRRAEKDLWKEEEAPHLYKHAVFRRARAPNSLQPKLLEIFVLLL